jgi:hypothetical protein
MKLFLVERGFIDRPTHNRLAALRQASRLFPETGKLREAGRPGPPPFLFSSHVFALLIYLVVAPFSGLLLDAWNTLSCFSWKRSLER